MIVNTETGEIIDFKPLRRKPRGRVSRPKSTSYQRQPTTHLERDMQLAVVLGVAITVLCELAK